MNYAWAEERVTAFIALLVRHRDVGTADVQSRTERARLETKINEGLLPIIEIAERVNPGLKVGLTKLNGGYHWRHATQLSSCEVLLGAIRDREELIQNLGPQGPNLAAAQLHAWVWGVAASLWDDGYRREAVQASATAVFDGHLRAKLGLPKAKPQELAGAFASSDPTPGNPRLRLPGYTKGTDDWRSAHDGAAALGRGCALAVRNLATHSVDQPEAQVALEALATLSLFARWCDQAALETV